MVNFLAKSLRSGRRTKFGRKVLLGARKKFRRGARETTIWGGGGGVGREMWFNFFPYIHQHGSEAESQTKLFVLCFSIKNKKCTEKKIVRVSLLLITLFSMLKTVCLGYRTYKEKSLKESTRETRGAGQRRMVTSETNLSSKCKMFLQDTTNKEELFSLLTKNVRDFQSPENKEVNITSGDNVFSSSGSSGHEDATTRKLIWHKNCCACSTRSQ